MRTLVNKDLIIMNSINEIINILKTCQTQHIIEKPDSINSDDIQQILNKSSLSTLLYDIKETMGTSDYSVGSSLRHENGFIKLSLYKDPNTSLQMRLHIWPVAEQFTNYHNHRWNFLSFILKGTLTAYNWDLDYDPNGKYTVIELSDADASLSKTKKNPRSTNLECGSSYRLISGNYHYANYKQVHLAFSPTASISLMITGTPLVDYSNVIYLNEERSKIPREKLSTMQCLKILDKLIGAEDDSNQL